MLTTELRIIGLLLCELQGGGLQSTIPHGLGLVYYCRLASGDPLDFDGAPKVYQSYEILTVEWVDSLAIPYKLAPMERKAIPLAKQAFDPEQAEKLENRN